MSHKYRRSYNDDGDDGRYRRSPREGGRRGRPGVFKYKRGRRGGGLYPPFSSKIFDNAMTSIRHGNKFHDGDNLEELAEQDPVKWHKLSVIYGAQVSKEWIVDKLKELGDEDFRLINFQTEGKNVVTFVRTKDSVVRKIRRQSHNFVDPVGKRMTLNMISVNEPSVSRITEIMEHNIMICLNNRYSFDTKILDLDSFNKDTHLDSVELYLPLSRQIVAQYISRILLEKLEELNGLILSNNQLETLVHFKSFSEKFPQMKIIDVSFNRLRHDGTLDIFKGCSQIESIKLQGNPFFRSQSVETYGTIIRRRFPNLLKLNGKDLPPRISFGVEESRKKSLPDPTLGHFPSEEMRFAIVDFLKSFYDKYDSGKRDSLLDMYSDDAVLTLCVAASGRDIRQKCTRYSDAYFGISRNLLRVKDDERRKKMVCRGKLQAVSALDRLPKTEHFLDSFRVDVLFHNERTIFMNITGVYREDEEHGSLIRIFTRTLQVESPLSIKIDNLIISHPSVETDKKYRDASSRIATPEPVVATSGLAVVAGDTISQDDLVKNMMRESGMNEKYSRQCLSDYSFDYNEAMNAFIMLKNANKIPPDAFS